jgi:AraC-like DNA-binding protein
MKKLARDLTQRLFGADRALFLGPLPTPDLHAHPVWQAAVGLEAPLRVTLQGAPPLTADAVLIASDAAHAVAGRGIVGHFYLAPTSPEGARLARWLGRRPALALPPGYARDAAHALQDAWRDRGPGSLDRALDALVSRLMELAPAAAATSPAPSPDARVERALARLSRRPDDVHSLAEVARALDLSPDRLRHLFRQEVGTPFRRYRRWLRLMRATDALRVGASVTEAAYVGGFADAAHFSRTFRAAFTVSPSSWRAGSRFVQAGGAPAA